MPRNPAAPIISAEDTIARALEIDDHYDRLEFLKAWSEGDWNGVREFLTPDLSRVLPELGSY